MYVLIGFWQDVKSMILGIIKIFPSMRFWEDIDHKPYFFIFYIGFVVLVSGLSAEATRWVVFCNQK